MPVLLVGLAAPAAAQGVATTYVPSPQVDAQVRQRLVAALRARDPAAASRLQAALQQRDFRAVWAGIVASDGLHRDDVADAIAAYRVLNWAIVHGRTDNTRNQMLGVRRQVLADLAADPRFRELDDAGRQIVGDTLVYRFVLELAGYEAATKAHDVAALRRLADAAEQRLLAESRLDLRREQRLLAESRLDLRRLALTDDGLRPSGPSP